MLIRLILALLLAAFTLPNAAAAACHDTLAPGAAAHAMPMSHPAPRQEAVAVHGCIGCIPPSDWWRAPIVAPVPAPQPLLAATIRPLDLGRAAPPALPPPRIA
ncbi:hypothetical protein ACU5AX_11595 [Sphingomonas sp. XXL09]|uniref:hypothetical protein n=1 Tax=Sphingomonas sp. XXL09 TaxID=3457787 RepID=UPI00406BBF39